MNKLLNCVFVVLFNALILISKLTKANRTIQMERFVDLNNSVSHKRKQFDFELTNSENIEKIDLNLIIERKAFAGGVDINGQQLFICRVRAFNQLIPGKYSTQLKKCAIAYNNREILYSKYQLLIESKSGSYDWAKVKTPAKQLPSNIVLGGVGSEGQFYYICQCRVRSQHISFISNQIGSVQFNQSIEQWMATVPFSGQQIQCLDYSVLIMAERK